LKPGAFKPWVNGIQLAQPHHVLSPSLCSSTTASDEETAVKIVEEAAETVHVSRT
jgi:hypothetical protein